MSREDQGMERRRKKPDGKSYGILGHRGLHSDHKVLEVGPESTMILDGAESHGETRTPLSDTLTFPERRAPLWVTLSVAAVAALVVGMVSIGLVRDARPTGGTGRTNAPAAVMEYPEEAPEPAPTVTVRVPGPERTVRVPVPVGAGSGTPTPVPGPTVTVTETVTPRVPVKPAPTVTVTVTETVPVPGPTVTVTETVTPSVLDLIP